MTDEKMIFWRECDLSARGGLELDVSAEFKLWLN